MIANWHGTEIPENEWAFSNDDFDSTHFKPHGSVVLWPHENIVRFEVSGPFNLEFIKSIAVLVGKVYSELAEKGPFVDVVVLKNSMLMPNEAVKEICNFFQESKMRGYAPEATAWVLEDEVEGSFILLPIFERQFNDIGRRSKNFDDVDEAEAWAVKQLRNSYI